MFELRSDGMRPELTLDSHESRNIINVLKFRLRCIRERKIGAVMLPFGQAFYVDAQGNYMDGKTPPDQLELSKVLMELKEAATQR
jgi:hypothetical protein